MKNNKLFFALMTFFFASQIASAQPFDPPAYKKGDFIMNAGIGLLPTAASPNMTSVVPPLSLSANYRVSKNASVGVFAAFASTSFSSDLPEHKVIPRSSDSQQFMLGVRSSVHYDINKTSFYGGLMLGYNSVSKVTNIPVIVGNDELTYPTTTNGKVIYSAFIGGQQMLTKRLGVYGEVGYGVSIFNLGLSVKL